MTDNRKFVADVDRFAELTKDKMLRVAKQSLQDVVRKAQTPVSQGGDMPVDTGFLRNSLVAEIGGVQAGRGADSYILALSSMELGDPFRVAWTAEYAVPRHYLVGVGQGGGLWRDKAAQTWSMTVAKNARLVR